MFVHNEYRQINMYVYITCHKMFSKFRKNYKNPCLGNSIAYLLSFFSLMKNELSSAKHTKPVDSPNAAVDAFW